ncbi:MAG: helix-turn-helix domain-containing protein [Polyangiales bacterium]
MRKSRSSCPVACALDLIGDRWTLLVVRDLLFGAHYFDDFKKSPEGIATNILGQRLRFLHEHGFVSRTADEADGRRVRYALTERGKSLEPVMMAVARWGAEHVEGAKMPPLPAKSRARGTRKKA